MEKTSQHAINNLSKYDNNIKNGLIRCFITNIQKLNFNNVEVMTTLEFKPSYNTFIIKTITMLNKNQKNFDRINKNTYQSLNSTIFNRVKSIKLV
jgi:hypothetical protein